MKTNYLILLTAWNTFRIGTHFRFFSPRRSVFSSNVSYHIFKLKLNNIINSLDSVHFVPSKLSPNSKKKKQKFKNAEYIKPGTVKNTVVVSITFHKNHYIFFKIQLRYVDVCICICLFIAFSFFVYYDFFYKLIFFFVKN